MTPAQALPASRRKRTALVVITSAAPGRCVRQLNRPVVLTLTDNNGASHQATLVALNTESAMLSFGGTRMTFSVDAISKFWFGQFMLIWRPPNGSDEAISPGMQNENVRWLRQSLAAIDTNY